MSKYNIEDLIDYYNRGGKYTADNLKEIANYYRLNLRVNNSTTFGDLLKAYDAKYWIKRCPSYYSSIQCLELAAKKGNWNFINDALSYEEYKPIEILEVASRFGNIATINRVLAILSIDIQYLMLQVIDWAIQGNQLNIIKYAVDIVGPNRNLYHNIAKIASKYGRINILDWATSHYDLISMDYNDIMTANMVEGKRSGTHVTQWAVNHAERQTSPKYNNNSDIDLFNGIRVQPVEDWYSPQTSVRFSKKHEDVW